MAKKKKEKNFNELTTEELYVNLDKAKGDLFKLKFRAASAPVKNPMEIRHLRKDIARLNTFVNQRRKS